MKKLARIILISTLCVSMLFTPAFADEPESETAIVSVSSFEELKEAVALAPNDGSEYEISIVSDIETNATEGSIQIADGQNVIIKDDGSERTINRTGNRKAEIFNVQEGAKLCLMGDLILDGEGYTDGQYDNRKSGVVTVSGDFVLEGATIRNFMLRSHYSAAVYVAGSGNFIMNSGSISEMDCRNQCCSAVFVWENGSFTLNGGYIKNNIMAIHDLDTAVIRIEAYNGQSSFTMNGGVISDNEAYCGAVFIGLLNNDLFASPTWKWDLASATINGGVIEHNKATFSGGAVSVMGPGELTINDGNFIGNQAPMGGAIAVYDLYKAFENSTSLNVFQFEDVYNMPAKLTVNGGNFLLNKAIGIDNAPARSAASDIGCGGAFYLSSMNVEINKANILNNYAEHQGGGVYVGAIPYEIKIRNAVITENTADDIGAGIWTCPTGLVVEWLVNGAAVYGNVLTNGQPQDTYYEAKIVGLGDASAVYQASDFDMTYNSADVLIKYNHSAKGGGLGTNGTYIFGDDIPVPEPIVTPTDLPQEPETPPIPPMTITTVQPPQPSTPDVPQEPEMPPIPPETTSTAQAPQPPAPTTPALPPETVEPYIINTSVVIETPTITTVVEPAPEEQTKEEPKLDVVPKTGADDVEKVNSINPVANVKIASITLREGYTLPVAQAPKSDPMRYLRRNLNGKYSISGTIFADASCDINSNNLLLYGHNMKNGTMFSDLDKYEDVQYLENHKIIHMTTASGEERDYEVIAAFRDKVYFNNENCFKYYKYAGRLDEDAYYDYLANIMIKSNTNIDIPEYGTRLLTLSTCAYHTENGRFVVVAKEIR